MLLQDTTTSAHGKRQLEREERGVYRKGEHLRSPWFVFSLAGHFRPSALQACPNDCRTCCGASTKPSLSVHCGHSLSCGGTGQGRTFTGSRCEGNKHIRDVWNLGKRRALASAQISAGSYFSTWLCKSLCGRGVVCDRQEEGCASVRIRKCM